jgi:hypothetical protein
MTIEQARDFVELIREKDWPLPGHLWSQSAARSWDRLSIRCLRIVHCGMRGFAKCQLASQRHLRISLSTNSRTATSVPNRIILEAVPPTGIVSKALGGPQEAVAVRRVVGVPAANRESVKKSGVGECHRLEDVCYDPFQTIDSASCWHLTGRMFAAADQLHHLLQCLHPIGIARARRARQDYQPTDAIKRANPGKLEACEPLRGLQLPGYRRWVDLQELVNLLEAARGKTPRRYFLTQIDFSRF